MVKQPPDGVARFFRILLTVVMPFAIGVGAIMGGWYAIRGRVERLEEHHETLEAHVEDHIRNALERMRIGDGGPVDPGIRYGIRLQMESVLREYLTRAEWSMAWERFLERNPSLKPPPGFRAPSEGDGGGG